MPSDTSVKHYRHLKRGTVYEVIGHAELQAAQPQLEHADLIVYRGEDGKLWARNSGEFHDGRFEAITPTDTDTAMPAGEATDEMLDALFPISSGPVHYMGESNGGAAWKHNRKEQRKRYAAMLAASPKPDTDTPVDPGVEGVEPEPYCGPTIIYPGGRSVRVTEGHVAIAKRIYAVRPFVIGCTPTTHGATMGRACDWDAAPNYYQSDMLELAHAALAAKPIAGMDAGEVERLQEVIKREVEGLKGADSTWAIGIRTRLRSALATSQEDGKS